MPAGPAPLASPKTNAAFAYFCATPKDNETIGASQTIASFSISARIGLNLSHTNPGGRVYYVLGEFDNPIKPLTSPPQNSIPKTACTEVDWEYTMRV